VILTGNVPMYTGPTSYGTGGTTSSGEGGFASGFVLTASGGFTLTGDCQLLIGPAEALTTTGGVEATGNVSFDPSTGVLDMSPMWGDEAKVIVGSALLRVHDSAQNYATYSYQPPNLIHDSREWIFVVPETDSWTMYVLGTMSSDHGIATWQLDGSAFGGSNDFYNSGGLYNTVNGIYTGTLAAGVHTLRMTINSKNPSSSGYAAVITKIWIQK
jgi:hypothetical protein